MPSLKVRSRVRRLHGLWAVGIRTLRKTPSSQIILADAFEKRMPHLALGGLRPVFDLGQQLRLHPDTPVRDARFCVAKPERALKQFVDIDGSLLP